MSETLPARRSSAPEHKPRPEPDDPAVRLNRSTLGWWQPERAAASPAAGRWQRRATGKAFTQRRCEPRGAPGCGKVRGSRDRSQHEPSPPSLGGSRPRSPWTGRGLVLLHRDVQLSSVADLADSHPRRWAEQRLGRQRASAPLRMGHPGARQRRDLRTGRSSRRRPRLDGTRTSGSGWP